MRVVVSEFMSLDGVVQAPGGTDEDTSGGFRHGRGRGRAPCAASPVIDVTDVMVANCAFLVTTR